MVRSVGANSRMLKIGVKGWADIIGCSPDGKFYAFEVKTGNARQTKEQKNFQKAIESKGGIYIVVRSLNDLDKTER